MLGLCDVPVFFERTSHNNMTVAGGMFRPALRLGTGIVISSAGNEPHVDRFKTQEPATSTF